MLDASVLIAHLDGADAHHAQAVSLLAASGGQELAASVITLAEVLVVPERLGRSDAALEAIEQLGVSSIELDGSSPARLAGLRVKTGLKMPDCCVLDAATQRQGKVATFDSSLAKAARELSMAYQNDDRPR